MTTALFSAPEHREMASPDHSRAYPAEYDRGSGYVDLEHTCGEPSEFCSPRLKARCGQPLVNHRCSLHGHQGEST